MDRASAISVLEDTKRASERCLTFLTEDDASYYTFKERNEALDMAIAALREQEQSKWISVKERLPEAHRLVLCRWTRGIGASYGFARYQYDDVWYVSNEGMPEVTHWMPLPEPPKEGAENG